MIGKDIVFIDKTTGTPVYPSRLQMHDGSVGVYKVMQVFFMSRLGTAVNVSIEVNPVISLIDGTKIDGAKSLADIKRNTLVLTGEDVGESGWKIYNFYIIAASDSEGSYSVDLSFSSRRRQSYGSIPVCVDLYGEREELSILLHNQGVDLPKDISRVFPETDIRDSKPDWLLLNRKYKELLLNAVDILYKKGSYKSLQASLDWFEYGDGLKLREFWSTPAMVHLHEKELTMEYSEVIKEMMEMYMKTTFVSLVLSADMLSETDGKVDYEMESGECTVPMLKSRELRWSVDDMMLKLTLLGNYFSTYFMPIHLDLLYSSLEWMVFTSPAKTKVVHNPENIAVDLCDAGWRVRVDGVYDEYVIGDAYCAASENTPLMSTDMTFGLQVLEDLSDKDTYKNNNEDTDVWSDAFENNLHIGSYAVIPVTLTVTGPNSDRVFPTLSAWVDCGDGSHVSISSPVNLRVGGSIDVMVYVGKSGKKTIGFNLISNEGSGAISGRINVNVLSPESNHFDFTIMGFTPVEKIRTADILDGPRYLEFFGDKKERTSLKYPDTVMQWVYPFTLDQTGCDVIMPDGSTVHYTDPGELEAGIKEWYHVLWMDTDGADYKVYLICREIGTKPDVTVAGIRGEFRLVPFMWKDLSVQNPRAVHPGQLIHLLPQDVLVECGETWTWMITNGADGETHTVPMISEPLVSGCNSGVATPGLHTVSLAVKYPNGTTVLHIRKNIYRIVES